jgi:hypothetical protein
MCGSNDITAILPSSPTINLVGTDGTADKVIFSRRCIHLYIEVGTTTPAKRVQEKLLLSCHSRIDKTVGFFLIRHSSVTLAT